MGLSKLTSLQLYQIIFRPANTQIIFFPNLITPVQYVQKGWIMLLNPLNLNLVLHVCVSVRTVPTSQPAVLPPIFMGMIQDQDKPVHMMCCGGCDSGTVRVQVIDTATVVIISPIIHYCTINATTHVCIFPVWHQLFPYHYFATVLLHCTVLA